MLHSLLAKKIEIYSKNLAGADMQYVLGRRGARLAWVSYFNDQNDWFAFRK